MNSINTPVANVPDYTPRVLDEAGELLARIRQRAVVTVDNRRDVASIDELKKLVTQAHHIFALVTCYGPQLLSEEFLQLLSAVQEGRIRQDMDPDPVMALAVEKLEEYVDYLKGGGQDLPLALLPLLNNMRACYGGRLLSEALIVSPHFQIPQLVRVDLTHSDSGAGSTSVHDFLTVVNGSGIPLMQNLVEWYRHRGEHSLVAIAGLFDSLKNASPGADLASLWRAAEAVTRSVVSGDLEGNAAIRFLLAQLERYLRRLGTELEQGNTVEYPDSVFKNLLYYVALSTSGSETVQQLKQQYRLSELLPPRARLDQARSALPGKSARLADSICHSLLQELAGVSETIEQLDVDDAEANRAALSGQRRCLIQLSATVMLLGLNDARRMNDHLIALIDRYAITGAVDELAEVATALLQVEHSLELYRQSSQQTLLTLDNPDWTRFNSAKLSPHQYDRIVEHFLLECSRLVIQAQQHYLIACEQSAQTKGAADNHLSSAVTGLSTLNKAVTILPLPEIQPLLHGAAYYLAQLQQRYLQPNPTDTSAAAFHNAGASEDVAVDVAVPDDEQQAFAELMVCCELYLDPVLQRQSIAGDLLTTADIALQRLQSLTGGVGDGEDMAEYEATTALLPSDLTLTTKPAIEDSLSAMSAIHRYINDWHQTQSDQALMRVRDQYHFLATLSERHGAPENTRTLEWFATLNRDYLNSVLNRQIDNNATVTEIVDEASAVLPQLVNATAQGGAGTGFDHQGDGIDGFDPLIKKLQLGVAQWQTGSAIADDTSANRSTNRSTNRLTYDDTDPAAAGDAEVLQSDVTVVVSPQPLADQTEILEDHPWAETVFAGTQTEVVDDVRWAGELDKTRVITPADAASTDASFDDTAEFPAFFDSTDQTQTVEATPAESQDDSSVSDPISGSASHSSAAHLGVAHFSRPDASRPDESRPDVSGQDDFDEIHEPSAYQDRLDHDSTFDQSADEGTQGQLTEALTQTSLDTSLDNTLLRVFFAESELHLGDIRQQLDHAPQVLPDHELQRSLHTLHGSARTANVPVIASLIGPLEEVTNHKLVLGQPYTTTERALVSDTVDAAFKVVNALSDQQAVPVDIAEQQLRLADFILHFRTQTDSSDATLGLQDLFLEEAAELLESMQGAVEQMQQPAQFDPALRSLRADLHTLKGSSRVARFNAIADLAHAAEGALIRWVTDEAVGLNVQQHDLLQDVIDALTMNLEQARNGGSLGQFDWLINQLGETSPLDDPQPLPSPDEGVSNATVKLAAGEDLTQIIPTPYTKPLAAGSQRDEPRTTVLPQALFDGGATGHATSDNVHPTVDTPQPVATETDQVRLDAQSIGELTQLSTGINLGHSRLSDDLLVIRESLVDLDKTTDRLRYKLRELQHQSDLLIAPDSALGEHGTMTDATTRFSQEELDQQSRLREDSRQLNEMLADFDSIRGTLRERLRSAESQLAAASRQGSDIGQALLRSRLIPFSQHTQRLGSLIRQTAGALERHVNWQLIGGELEIDRGIHKALMSPIEHLITNAIAHGIESPESRLQQGKQASGQITVTVELQANELIVTVEDDGAGVDLNQLRQQPDLQRRFRDLSDNEVIDALFESGVSTQQQANQYAGRGIGLNAVKRAVDKLGGTVTLASAKGEGTRLTISVTQPVTISQVILVTVGEMTLGIPVDCVHAVQSVSDANACVYNDVSYNTCHVEHMMTGAHHDAASLKNMANEAVLVEVQGRHLALRVDAVLGYRELITHLAGSQLRSLGWVRAAGLLPDGRCVFIADMQVLNRRWLSVAAGSPVDDDPLLATALPNSAIDHTVSVATVPTIDKRQPGTAQGDLVNSRALFNGSRVLVVDDSVTMRAYATRLLSVHGVQISVARDGIEALEQLNEQCPDLVLLDLEMPRMGGFEVLSAVRKNPLLAHLPVVIISSRSNLSSRQQASELGVSGFLVKPYRENELLRLLERSLGADRSDRTVV